MKRISLILVALTVLLTACTPTDGLHLGSDGKPLPRLYRITAKDSSEIQFRVLDSVNALREAAGLGQVSLNAKLNAAAATHSRDMSNQNRPWHFGSDGSSPIDRVVRVGYDKMMLGENISETFETELETLAAWMDQTDTRAVILNRNAVDMGFAWKQDQNGKIWWTLLMGG